MDEWLDDALFSAGETNSELAKALSAMGTNALPFLLKEIQVKRNNSNAHFR
ncbi:MAG: hypothetical protein HC846_05250 [Blastocatellia bacterium]|nr:hypothetical protein [Blastocatellia bacterium]